MAAISNIQHYAGEHKIITCKLDPPESIAGWEIHVIVINGFKKTTVTVTDINIGEFEFIVEKSDTVNMQPKTYRYTIERVNVGFEAVLTKGAYVILNRESN